MKTNNFTFEARDKQKIYFYRWLPDNPGKTRAVLHIIHGMGDHAKKYEGFADKLTRENFAVYASDLRGHGRTAAAREDLGHFADSRGWFLVLDDLVKLNDIIEKENPKNDIFLFGHNAGSLLARDYVMMKPCKLRGIILATAAASPGVRGITGILLSRILIKLKGPKAKSPLLRRLAFNKYNSFSGPVRTAAEWVTKDEKIFDAITGDPFYCSLFSAVFYEDLAKAAYRVNYYKNIKKIPENLSIFLLTGTKCPSSDYMKGPLKIYTMYINARLKDLSIKLYEDEHCDLLNGINRQEVYEDIITWLSEKATHALALRQS